MSCRRAGCRGDATFRDESGEGCGMGGSILRIGIAGCSHAARVHLQRLLSIDTVRVVGCADTDLAAAQSLAGRVVTSGGEGGVTPAFGDHREMIKAVAPDA